MEDGRSLVSGEVGPGDRLQCDAFRGHCSHWCELYQPDPTRRDIVNRELRALARLDRVYTTLLAGIPNEMTVVVNAVGAPMHP
eukprot:3198191-Pyramimonas_sp.AAC.1